MFSPARRVVLWFALPITGIEATAAQGNTTNTIKNCSEAAQVVETGRPAHKQLAGLDSLARCGLTGASAVSGTVLQSRTEQELDALGAFYQRLQAWRDSSVMEAAAQVARDPAATVPSRVSAIGYLLWLTNPGYQYPYVKLLEGIAVPRLPCVARYTSEHPSSASVGSPLPLDYAIRLRTILR